MKTNDDGSVTLTPDEANARQRYLRYNDDDIDNIINIVVRGREASWLNRIGAAKLNDGITIAQEQAKQARMKFEQSCTAQVKLREVMLNTTLEAEPITDPADARAIVGA